MWDWTGSGSALGPKWTRWSPPPFVWQAWHLVTSTVTLAWQAWHLWDWTGSGVRPHNLSRLVHTTCPHTTCRHTCVAHANPSPSLFSFPHFPSHLYLSFASYWKKLTCGVIRSFNWFLFFAAIYTRIGLCFFFSREKLSKTFKPVFPNSKSKTFLQ